MQAFAFIRQQDILIVSGGGQLDEEWGGKWGHPFSLVKWSLLARTAGVPIVFVSVGACRISSMLTKLFIAWSLRLALYRSFRDAESKAIACKFYPKASRDPIVPDLAFFAKPAQISDLRGSRPPAHGKKVVAISPIAFGRSGLWPTEKMGVYKNYVCELASVADQLIEEGWHIAFVVSSLGDDEAVIPEVLGQMRHAASSEFAPCISRPSITSWQDLVAVLKASDLLIASRLHSAILGFVSEVPVVAISFDPKVDWVMGDLGLREYLFHITDFGADQILKAVGQARNRRDEVRQRISEFRTQARQSGDEQFDRIAALVLQRCKSAS